MNILEDFPNLDYQQKVKSCSVMLIVTLLLSSGESIFTSERLMNS